ncbi:MAG: hypothetical protein WC979_05365 [Candidatus Pacearchaeota archaeon]|jgi:hypothetical protein
MKNKKGYALLIVIIILLLGIILFGKPIFVWILEKTTNKTIMPDMRNTSQIINYTETKILPSILNTTEKAVNNLSK